TPMPELIKLARRPNIAVKATGAPGYCSGSYPFTSMHTYLRQIYDAFGPTRMFWGTDITKMPCSWRQCVTMFTEELPWLPERDKELIMGQACAPGGVRAHRQSRRIGHDTSTATSRPQRIAGNRGPRDRSVEATRGRDPRLDPRGLCRACGAGLPGSGPRRGRARRLRPPLRRAAASRADQVSPRRVSRSVLADERRGDGGDRLVR